MNWETLLCFGDSITIGARSYLGYPEYCGDTLQTQTGKHWMVVNHAVSGYTTSDLVRSIDQNWANLMQVRPEVVSLMIGTNDLKSKTSDQDFKIAYSQLLLKAHLLAGHSNLIVYQIPYLQEGVMLPYKLEMNRRIDELNSIILDLAHGQGYLTAKMQSDPSHFFDGVHLNGQGSLAWGKQLAQKILDLRRG